MESFRVTAARDFAVEIVKQLRAAGYQALWAGGCVRDSLLNKTPKDFDVATSAQPEQVRQVFGRRRTLAIGAAFGVISVVGNKQSGNVEVATFRRDEGYSDGRHPDSVTFSTAEHDAQRRDFTINGLFYDPLEDQVIDYVGGHQDLQRGVIRAIGDPQARFEEDKLRILRAIRFASVLEFRIEEETRWAIEQRASELVIVSAERISAELRKMLTDSHRRRAVELLAQTGLLAVVFPEGKHLLPDDPDATSHSRQSWQAMLTHLGALSRESFPIALALLLRNMVPEHMPAKQLALQIGSRLKLSNEESGAAAWLLEHEAVLAEADRLAWPQVQRLLIHENSQLAPGFLEALSSTELTYQAAAEYCVQKLALPTEQLNPVPLVTGNDLQRLGLAPGPQFKTILAQVRDQQLLGLLQNKTAAIEYVRAITPEA